MTSEIEHKTHEDARKTLLERWLIDTGIAFDALESASADASFRRYFRLTTQAGNLIAMDSPPQLNDNQPFLAITEKLQQADINAPKIIASDLKLGFIVLTDFGTTHYLDVLNEHNVEQLYADAINTIAKMQARVDCSELAHYDAARLRTEMQLFSEWYIVRHKGLDATSWQSTLDKAFQLCIDSALEQPQVFVHRDYHSRNLMLTAENSPGVLDYQDAVIGAITYDPVSLLKDCYIEWPDKLIDEQLEHHRRLSVAAGLTTATRPQYERWFDLMGLQRHIKVMGIFCRLNYRDAKPAYMNDLALVSRYIRKVTEKYSELADFRTLLTEVGADEEFA